MCVWCLFLKFFLCNKIIVVWLINYEGEYGLDVIGVWYVLMIVLRVNFIDEIIVRKLFYCYYYFILKI